MEFNNFTRNIHAIDTEDREFYGLVIRTCIKGNSHFSFTFTLEFSNEQLSASGGN